MVSCPTVRDVILQSEKGSGKIPSLARFTTGLSSSLPFSSSHFDGIELTREKTYHLAYAVAQIADTNWPDVMRMAFVNRVNCWKTQRWVISSQAPDGVYNFQS
jgi:hypothetical protein